MKRRSSIGKMIEGKTEDITTIIEANEYKIKIDLPSFDAKMDIEGFLEWIKNVESFFGICLLRIMVKLVALKLKSGASAWWEQLETNRQRFGKPPIRTWEKMKKRICARLRGFSVSIMNRFSTISIQIAVKEPVL